MRAPITFTGGRIYKNHCSFSKCDCTWQGLTALTLIVNAPIFSRLLVTPIICFYFKCGCAWQRSTVQCACYYCHLVYSNHDCWHIWSPFKVYSDTNKKKLTLSWTIFLKCRPSIILHFGIRGGGVLFGIQGDGILDKRSWSYYFHVLHSNLYREYHDYTVRNIQSIERDLSK